MDNLTSGNSILSEAVDELRKSRAHNEEAEQLLEYFQAMADVRLLEWK
jgi:hypothetical protein